MAGEIIFSGKDIRVVSALQDRSGPVLVTFQPAAVEGAEHGFTGGGFGENWAVKRCAAVLFKSRYSHWYQSTETEDALETARQHLQGRDIVTYGSSMGGYAAIVTSKALQARRVIALSPQYSIDPQKVPWDTRYNVFARHLNFFRDDMQNLVSRDAEIYVFYDPFDLDHLHHREISRVVSNLISVRVPFAGHPASARMKDAGVLGLALSGIFDAHFDQTAFTQIYARNKRNLAGYWSRLFNLARGRGTRSSKLEVIVRGAGNRGHVPPHMSVWMLNHLRDQKRFENGVEFIQSLPKAQLYTAPGLTTAAVRLLQNAGLSSEASDILAAAQLRNPDHAGLLALQRTSAPALPQPA